MTEQYKAKLKKIIQMNGVPICKFKHLGTPSHVILKSLTTIGINYQIRNKHFKLKTSPSEAYNLIDDYEDNPLANKYDYTILLKTLKERLLSSDDFCTILHCRPKDYKNIITYLSMKYPIYEEDDERVGYLIS